MSDRKFKGEIRDYEVEFDSEKPVDVNDLQAALIIREVLDALEVDHDKIHLKKKTLFSYEVEKGGVVCEFPRGEPEYWHAEFDVEAKVVEVGMNDHVIRIPMATVLYWFSKAKENLK